MNRKWLITGLVLFAAAAGIVGYLWFASGNGVMRLHGVVEIQEVRLSSKVGGRVKDVLVKEGDMTSPGQPLVEFEAPELHAQKEQLRARVQAAEAMLDKAYNGPRPEEKALAKAAMDSAEARWQMLKKGYRVEEKEQARGELDAMQAEWQRAQREYERIKGLYPTAASKSDFDSAAAAYFKVQGQVRAAKSKLTHMEAGFRPEEIAQAEAEYRRAKANFDLAEAGTRREEIVEAEAKVAELRAKLHEIEVNLREAVVTAPEKAIVEVIAVRKGDVVAANQPVIRVLRADDLWVKAYVPEVELGKVKLHHAVEVVCDSYPNKRFQGTVTQIASISEFTPRNVQTIDERRHQVFAIKVRVDDPQGVFKSGMAAEVFLPVDAK